MPTAMWTLVETYATVISACFFVIKPGYVKLFLEKLLARLEIKSCKKMGKPHFDSFSHLRVLELPLLRRNHAWKDTFLLGMRSGSVKLNWSKQYHAKIFDLCLI